MALTLSYTIQTWDTSTSSWINRFSILRASATVDVSSLAGLIMNALIIQGEPKAQLVDALTGLSVIQIDQL
jgi:putative copper export protein